MSQNQAEADKEITGRDVHRAAEAAFKKGADALAHADYDKTEKLFGLFEVDAGLAEYLKSAYNVLSDQASHFVMPLTFGGAKYLGSKAGLNEQTAQKTAAVATVAVDTAMRMGGYLGSFIEGHKEHSKQKQDLARKLAPYLDEKIGKHSVSALSAASHDNEMIKVQLARINKIAGLKRTNNLIDIGANAGTSIALSALTSKRQMTHLWEGGDFKSFRKLEADRIRAKQEADGFEGPMQGMGLLKTMANTLSGPLSGRKIRSNEHKLKKSLSANTAMDMVLELVAQVENNPKSRMFQMPKPSRESYGLEEYIMRIMIQHQKDMADISPDHTELREALKDDMMAAAKPIAEAIHKGEINALQLITLIGEKQIIKSNGRGIASPEEVEDYLDRSAEKPAVAAGHTDPKAWMTQASFTAAELKTALKNLHGEERENFAVLFPDSVLEQAGLAAKEIKTMRESLAKRYEPMLMECVLGLAQRDDAELQREGLAKHEIKQLREAVKEIERMGAEAVHSLRAGPTNSHGIERAVTNWAVNNVEYFGRVQEEGRAAKEELGEPKRHSDHVEKHMGKHVERVRGHNDNEANDNERSHAERARAEAGHGHARH